MTNHEATPTTESTDDAFAQAKRLAAQLRPEEEQRSPDRLPDTNRTHHIANAQNAYRDEHALSPDAAIRAQLEHKAGTYLAGEVAAIEYDLGSGVTDAPAAERQQWADALSPEAAVERRNLERQADYDDLTGLANRRAFDKALPAAEADPGVAIASFDANNFGLINKRLGHEAGDAVLIELAHSLQQAAHQHGMAERVYRRGGDEFVVMAPKEAAQPIIDEAGRLFDERLAGDVPLLDAQGHKHETSRVRSLNISLSGVAANTFAEADAQLQAAKAARKAQGVNLLQSNHEQ